MSDGNSGRQGQGEDPRVRFAAERTLLAWLRTGLGLMGFGFVVSRFGLFLRELAAARQAPEDHSTRASLYIGVGLVALGVGIAVLAGYEHLRVLRRLSRGDPYMPPRWSLGLAVAVLLAAVGVGMMVYLLVVGR